MRGFLVALLVIVGLVPLWAEETAPALASADALDLVFFADKRPVLIRLHVRIDGLPFRDAFAAAWNDYIEHLFRYLDRNGDGFLSPEEAARAPAPSLVLPGPWTAGQAAVNFAFNFAVLDADGDGKVSREELAAFYQEYAGSALQPQFVPHPAPMTRSLNDVLFERLDRNKGGQLSKDELAAAATTLFQLDLNGDELLTPQELVGNVNQATSAGTAPSSSAGGFLPDNSAFHLATDDEACVELGRRIVSRYGQGMPRKVERKDINLDAATFERLDANKDGELDADELARFTRRQADVELIVRLGKAGQGEALVEVVLANDKPASVGAGVRATADGIGLQLGDALIELCRNQGKLRVVPGDRSFFLQQFKAIDVDNNGAIDRKEAQAQRFFAAWFDLMDRNGDGKVDEKEFLYFLDEIHDRLARVLANRAMLLISDEGRGLFDLLDKNRDGRLGLRELREAPKVLQQLAGGSAITRDNIPRSFRLALGLGQASFTPHGGNMVMLPPLDSPELAPDRLGVGPLWFRKMDRNRDGDVSPNEFLGTPEEFRRLDADGDGLISVEEAERADASLRKR
jgi:Ca2+-binding EF-hand superfamily protein